MLPPHSLKPQTSQSFTPKPFPPPALRNVPEAYIVSQVRHTLCHVWTRKPKGHTSYTVWPQIIGTDRKPQIVP